MKRTGSCLAALLAASCLLPVAAKADTQASSPVNVTWWDFFGGGDGIRMKAIIEKFNETHPNIQVQPTTLQWGTPFYTKVQTSAAVGLGPDIMTYHLSRIPLGVSTNSLRPFSDAEVASMGLSASDFPAADWKAAHVNGKLYAIPLDIHSIILYYNKDMLAKAGLLGPDGLPKNLNGLANFDAALKKLTGSDGAQYGVSFASLSGGGAATWRLFYTLLEQQDGTLIQGDTILPGDSEAKAVIATQTIADWIKEGWTPKETSDQAALALFTSGKAAMMIEGDWNVPVMVDLAKKNQLGFQWGAVQVPVLFDRPATWADSHSFAIPNRRGNPVPPDEIKADLTIISWIEHNAIMWAGGGHIPAYLPVSQSKAFKNMKPNSTYSSLTKTAVFDPVSVIAGVASPTYSAAENFLQPAINGQLSAKAAVEQFKEQLQEDLQ